jgi:hypothetical protein
MSLNLSPIVSDQVEENEPLYDSDSGDELTRTSEVNPQRVNNIQSRDIFDDYDENCNKGLEILESIMNSEYRILDETNYIELYNIFKYLYNS